MNYTDAELAQKFIKISIPSLNALLVTRDGICMRMPQGTPYIQKPSLSVCLTVLKHPTSLSMTQ